MNFFLVPELIASISAFGVICCIYLLLVANFHVFTLRTEVLSYQGSTIEPALLAQVWGSHPHYPSTLWWHGWGQLTPPPHPVAMRAGGRSMTHSNYSTLSNQPCTLPEQHDRASPADAGVVESAPKL